MPEIPRRSFGRSGIGAGSRSVDVTVGYQKLGDGMVLRAIEVAWDESGGWYQKLGDGHQVRLWGACGAGAGCGVGTGAGAGKTRFRKRS
jgi:hypothetical protein